MTGDADRTSRAYDRGNPTLIGALLPTPGAIDGGGGPKRIREDGRTEADHGPALRDVAVTLLPTPAVNDMGEGKTVERWDEWTADMQAKHGNGNGHGKSLAIEAQRLLPTPTTRDHKDHTIRREPHRPDAVDPLSRALTEWGDYAHAIAQWESIVGRPAPAPTMTSAKGNPQLAPAFVEWMMGLPDGWVTDVPGITRNEALKALGNGVVPQQCTAALREMFAWEVAAA